MEYLESSFREHENALVDCINGIDQQVMKLAVYIDEYRRLYASLNDMNEKIPGLGGEPRAMPEGIAGDSLAAILAARFDHLKSQGKI